MLSKILPKFIIGVFSFLLHVVNTLFWVVPILLLALLKVLLPVAAIRTLLDRLLNGCASLWISCNGIILQTTKVIDWEVEIPTGLSTKDWYLVMANHQSWVDILVLQKVFNGQVPFLKFFLKQQLIWVPVLGLAWWALDFPFMRRYSKSYIKKNPHKKGKDFETTKKACEKFKAIPISIMNFSEGTRFTAQKHSRQNSPYQHLLKPKAGGIGYVLTLMGNEITKILDVTIDYPNHHSPSFWDLMTGNLDKVVVHASLLDIPQEVQGSYIESPEQRRKVQQWVNELWVAKDQKLTQIRSKE
jgi:1-acyl-sn-glycerol-3-phosphate acyltransferase